MNVKARRDSLFSPGPLPVACTNPIFLDKSATNRAVVSVFPFLPPRRGDPEAPYLLSWMKGREPEFAHGVTWF